MGKTDEAYEWIKSQIITGAFPPLSDLSETVLQEKLQVSRTPVREALLRLEREDFVYIYPRKGTFVTDVTRDLIDEVYQMRLLLEPEMMVGAMYYISQRWLVDIRHRLACPPSDLSPKELRLYFIQLDTELHATFLEKCPNRYIRRSLKAVYDQNQRLRIAASHVNNVTDSSVEEHLVIVDACLDHDEEKLRQACIDHLQTSCKTVHHGFHK